MICAQPASTIQSSLSPLSSLPLGRLSIIPALRRYLPRRHSLLFPPSLGRSSLLIPPISATQNTLPIYFFPSLFSFSVESSPELHRLHSSPLLTAGYFWTEESRQQQLTGALHESLSLLSLCSRLTAKAHRSASCRRLSKGLPMAMRLAKLMVASESKISGFRFTLTKSNVAALVVLRPISDYCTTQNTGDDAKTKYEEFQKWGNGGGLFHISSCIDPSARLEIGALVHSDSVVGANTCVGSGSVIGPGVTIGQSTRTCYNVVLSNCTIGDFCVIHHGVCIGQDGFGFYVDEQGLMVKKPQCLKARIGNYVEIGANTCIDRGSWRDTVIGDHTKIDNLVQIGHNVEIGENCMLCGQVGVAGSVTIGEYVILGGRVSIRDHVCIASKVRLAANSCVTKNITKAGDYGGFPAIHIHEWRKQVISARQTSKEFWHDKKKFASDTPSPST